MSVVGVSVHQKNLEIMSLLTSETPGGITTYIERSAMPTPRQPMLNCCHAMSSEDSICFDMFPVSWVTSRSPTSSLQCRLACLSNSRSAYSSWWRHTNSSTSTIHSAYPCLLTTTSHQKTTHMRKFLNGIGRRWRKWAGSCLELEPSLYEAEDPLSVPYAIAQLIAPGLC